MSNHVGTWKHRVGSAWKSMPDVRFEPSRAAIVVVDLQNYSAHPDVGWAPVIRETRPDVAAYFIPRMHDFVLPNVRRLLDAARREGVRVIHVSIGPQLDDGADFLQNRRSTAQDIWRAHQQRTLPKTGTFEHEFAESVAPEPGEIVVNKVTRSAFTSTGIDQILRNLSITHLAFCGTATDSCVETTARDASDRGYYCSLIDDACATLDQDAHDSSMRVFDRFFGRVLTVDDLIAEFAPSKGEENRSAVGSTAR